MTIISDQIIDLAASIVDGSSLCLAPDYSGCAMHVIFELIRQRRRQLQLVGVPQLGLQADLLIGAGCVSSVDAAAVTLGEHGQAPRFTAAVESGDITMRDSTCPAIHAGLQASEKGIPFIPLRGLLGSDVLKHREDWLTIDNPFASEQESDPIVLVPAIKPDIALFHAPLADRNGNVWIGVRRELMLMAHAAKQTLVTVEQVVETDLMRDSEKAAGVISSLYIERIAVEEFGAAPVGLFNCYEPDVDFIRRYAQAARSQQGFAALMREQLDR